MSAVLTKTVVFCIAVWGSCIALLFFQTTPHWPVRIAVTAAGYAAFASVFRSNRRILFLSPFAIAGAMATIFYSLGPAAFSQLVSDTQIFVKPVVMDSARAYLQDRSELVMLQFAAMCFTGLTVSASLTRATGYTDRPQGLNRKELTSAIIAMGVLAALTVFLWFRRTTGFGDGNSTLFRELHHAMAPLAAICFVVLCHVLHIAPRRLAPLSAVGAMLVFSSLLMTANAKAPTYIVGAGILYAMVTTRPRLRTIGILGASYAVVLALAFIAQGFARGNYTVHYENHELHIANSAQAASPIELLGRTLIYKLLARQVETSGCLQNVFTKHLSPDAPAATGSPLYFLMAPIPRFLWPAKPVLSQGQTYGLEYCGLRPEDIAPGQPQSYSITLLGQPVIIAGTTGLIAAQIALALIFTVATLAISTQRTALRIGVVALTPWLIDIDQSFALYVGNVFKMLLLMLPFLVALQIFLKEPREPQP